MVLHVSPGDLAAIVAAIKDDNEDELRHALELYEHTDLVLTLPKSAERQLGASPRIVHIAAFYGAVKCFRCLAQTSDLTSRDQVGRCLCHFAAYSGSLSIFQLLLENAVPIDVAGVNRMTPFLIAAKFGHVELCKWLFVNGCDVHAVTADGKSALDLAVDRGHANVCEFLFKVGFSPEDYVQGSHNIWYRAVKEDERIEILDLLLSMNAAQVPDSSGSWPLHYAVASRKVHVIEALLEHGAEVGVQDHKGVTPLMLAVTPRSSDIMLMLLSHDAGASIDMVDSHGRTALHYAVRKNLIDAASLLLEFGANPTIQDNDDLSVYAIAPAVEPWLVLFDGAQDLWQHASKQEAQSPKRHSKSRRKREPIQSWLFSPPPRNELLT